MIFYILLYFLIYSPANGLQKLTSPLPNANISRRLHSHSAKLIDFVNNFHNEQPVSKRTNGKDADALMTRLLEILQKKYDSNKEFLDLPSVRVHYISNPEVLQQFKKPQDKLLELKEYLRRNEDTKLLEGHELDNQNDRESDTDRLYMKEKEAENDEDTYRPYKKSKPILLYLNNEDLSYGDKYYNFDDKRTSSEEGEPKYFANKYVDSSEIEFRRDNPNKDKNRSQNEANTMNKINESPRNKDNKLNQDDNLNHQGSDLQNIDENKSLRKLGKKEDVDLLSDDIKPKKLEDSKEKDNKAKNYKEKDDKEKDNKEKDNQEKDIKKKDTKEKVNEEKENDKKVKYSNEENPYNKKESWKDDDTTRTHDNIKDKSNDNAGWNKDDFPRNKKISWTDDDAASKHKKDKFDDDDNWKSSLRIDDSHNRGDDRYEDSKQVTNKFDDISTPDDDWSKIRDKPDSKNKNSYEESVTRHPDSKNTNKREDMFEERDEPTVYARSRERYDEDDRHNSYHKKLFARQGLGNTHIPYSGKKIIYDDK